MDITRDWKHKKLWLSQKKYVEWVLEKFNQKNAKSTSTTLATHFSLSKRDCPQSKEKKLSMSWIPYASVGCSLIYATICTRLDIFHAIGVVSRFLSNLAKGHWDTVKWILRRLHGRTKFYLQFDGCKPILKDYIDANMVGCLDRGKSTRGCVFAFTGGIVSWQSKL